jgi:sterol O-acyltransferase
MDTPGSDSGGELIATSTVTTQFQRREKGARGDELGQALDRALTEGEGGAEDGRRRETKTTTVTHLGARGMEHQIDKDGGVHLKPQQSPSSRRKGKKIRALVSFQPRNSRFDSFNRDAGKDP